LTLHQFNLFLQVIIVVVALITSSFAPLFLSILSLMPTNARATQGILHFPWEWLLLNWLWNNLMWLHPVRMRRLAFLLIWRSGTSDSLGTTSEIRCCCLVARKPPDVLARHPLTSVTVLLSNWIRFLGKEFFDDNVTFPDG